MSSSGAPSLVIPFGGRDGYVAHLRTSTVSDGDFHLDGPRAALEHRRRSFMPGMWTQLDEVHGAAVRRVQHPGEHDRVVGDALVSDVPGAVLGVWVGDCAPVVLVSSRGEIGVAHVGWKGALAGVVGALVGALTAPHRAPGSDECVAVLGPCIHPCCYEFGDADLAVFVERFGDSVVARTAWGTPALDMRAVVRAAFAVHDIALVEPSGMAECTGCHPDRYFSHRRRGERGRQMMAACIRASA